MGLREIDLLQLLLIIFCVFAHGENITLMKSDEVLV